MSRQAGWAAWSGVLSTAALLWTGVPGSAASQTPVVVPPETIGLSSSGLGRIAPLLQSYVDSGKIPGAVALVSRQGKVGYLEAVGQMDVAGKVPMRTDAVFRIYSMTKPVLAAAILKLAEEGRVGLDDPVSRYLPAFSRVQVYAGGSAADPIVRPAKSAITLQHLLTHTAGLSYGFFGDSPVDSIYNRANLFNWSWTTRQLVDSLARLPLKFSPGTGWNYSLSIDVLGAVVEVASGQSLDAFLEERLFQPLGMRETAFHVRPAMQNRIPVLYAPRAGGGLLAEDPLLADYYLPGNRLLMGGGGLLSTVTDYLRFAQMLLNGGELEGRRVLTRESVALMMRNHLPPELTPIEDPIVGHSGYGHGLGGVVLVDSTRAGLPGSPGIYRWWGIGGTFFWVDPAAGLIGMVWTQLSPGRTYPLEQDFQRVVYQALR